MSIEERERSGKHSGRAENCRSPGSRCHEYQLAIDEPRLLRHSPVGDHHTGDQSIGGTEEVFKLIFFMHAEGKIMKL